MTWKSYMRECLSCSLVHSVQQSSRAVLCATVVSIPSAREHYSLQLQALTCTRELSIALAQSRVFVQVGSYRELGLKGLERMARLADRMF